MKSVSGKYWEEEKINKRLLEKVKIENSFEDLTARQIISKKFSKEEIYLINNHINLTNPFLNNDEFIKATELLMSTKMSFFEIMPKSPCEASLADRLKEGVPTEASVAAILDAMRPLFPTPQRITFD